MMTKRSRDDLTKQWQGRARIADLAARYIAEHGIRDYGMAKRKAARQLDLPERQGLPSNEEVDQALMERQTLFAGEEQMALLADLRQEALQVMQTFSRFEPVLTGAVALGAVSEHSQIELSIQADTSKDFEQFLINDAIEFKVLDRGGQMAYLIYAEPADVLVRLPAREVRHQHAGHRTQLTVSQLESLLLSGKSEV